MKEIKLEIGLSTHKFDSVKPNQTFGGVGIFVKNHLVMDERKDLQIVNENIKDVSFVVTLILMG